MKKHWLLLAGLMVAVAFGGTVGFGQTWSKATSPSYPSISFNDTYFRDANTGYIIGSRGLFMRTTNGGTNWTSVTIDTLRTLYGVYFLNATSGYIGASKRTFMKTTDGGSTWSSVTVTTIPDTAADIRQVYFADAQRGWILSTLSSTNGRLLHTTDGGSTWTLDTTVAARNLIDMAFVGTRGIAVGGNVGTLLYTTNGTSWKPAATPALGGFNYTRSDIRSVWMIDSLTALAVGWGSSAAGLQPSIHLRTTDGGATWTYQTQVEVNRSYDNLYGVWFKDAQNGLALGGATRGSVCERTTDGGTTWTPIPFPCGATLNAISGSGNNVWVVGGDGVIYYSPDFGNTWQLKTEIPSASLNDMQWASSTVGYAGGFDGIFMKTTNGGKNWKAGFLLSNLVSPTINDICFVNSNVGYSAHGYRLVGKTTNGGTTWTAAMPETTAVLVSSYGVHFVDENLGFVVGREGSNIDATYKTTNGGATWSKRTNIVARALRSVHFASPTVGAAVGENLKGIYTTDGGVTWTASTFVGVPTAQATAELRGVKFLSPTTAIAVGNKVILKSTNGGAAWNYLTTGTNAQLYSVDFFDDSTGYAVGSGEVWKTTDMGDTWTNIINAGVVTGTLYSVAVDRSGFPWVGGASGTIFTTFPLVAVGPETPLPAGYQLRQNYPNPFNPATKIQFTIDNRQLTIVKVFDVLGREVATLVNEMRDPGTHTVDFDGSTFAGGVYLYQIKAGDFTQSRKMVLVK